MNDFVCQETVGTFKWERFEGILLNGLIVRCQQSSVTETNELGIVQCGEREIPYISCAKDKGRKEQESVPLEGSFVWD